MGIEDKLGTKVATEIDAGCWRIMGKIETRELRETLGVKETSVEALMLTLRSTGSAQHQTGKESEASAESGVFRVIHCRTQEAR